MNQSMKVKMHKKKKRSKQTKHVGRRRKSHACYKNYEWTDFGLGLLKTT